MKFRKDNIVQETKELAAASRSNTEKGTAVICGREFSVFPKVFDPRIFFSTNWFAKSVSELVKGERDFCEVGCGTGSVVSTVLIDNPELKGVAVDINPYAVENTKANFEKHRLLDRADVMVSNVFDSIPAGRTFDSIFWAMPFGYLEEGEEVDIVDLQTFDPGYRAIRKFFADAYKFLKPTGRLLVGFSHEIGTDELLEQLVSEYHFTLKLLTEEKGTEKSPVTMQIYEARLK